MNISELVEKVALRANAPRTARDRKLSKEQIDQVLRLALEAIADELEQGGEFNTPLLGRLHVRARGGSGAKSLYIQASQGMKARLRRTEIKGK